MPILLLARRLLEIPIPWECFCRSSLPEHENDPLEFGLLTNTTDRGFEGCGISTDGESDGRWLCKNGCELIPAPSVHLGDILGLEMTICPFTARNSVRFLVNGHYITKPLDLSGMHLPMSPVICIPSGFEVQIVDQIPQEFDEVWNRDYFMESRGIDSLSSSALDVRDDLPRHALQMHGRKVVGMGGCQA